MTNRYGGKCGRCGGWVPAGAGTVAKGQDGGWIVNHLECPEITSGLGIGGIGSDDYNIWTEGEQPTRTSYDTGRGGRRLDCGHIVSNPALVMSASLGTCCPDCYDRMSG